MPTILGTIDGNVNPKVRILELVNIKEGTNYQLSDVVFSPPEIPSIDNRVRNTRLLITPAGSTDLYGAKQVWYNRISGTTLPVINVTKGSATTVYQLLSAINTAAGILLTTDDVYDAVLPIVNQDGTVAISLDFKPTSLLFYGGAVLSLNIGFTKADRDLLDNFIQANVFLSNSNPVGLNIVPSPGVSTAGSRADHVHPLPATATTSNSGLMSPAMVTNLNTLVNAGVTVLSNAVPQSPGSASSGTSTEVSRADHVHAPSPLVTTTVAGLMSAAMLVTLNNLASATYVQLGSANPLGLAVSASPGVATTAAREDHIHALPAVASSMNNGLMTASMVTMLTNLNSASYLQLGNTTPAALGTAAVGTATTAAKSDHVHQLPANVTTTVDGLMSAADKINLNNLVSTNYLQLGSTPGAALGSAGVGVATTAARSDHTHALPAIATTTVAGLMSGAMLTTLNTLAATTFVPLGSTPALALGASALPGTSLSSAHEDHVHPLPAIATTTVNGLMAAADRVYLNNLATINFTDLQAAVAAPSIVSLAIASTVNIGAASSKRIHITGAGTINAFDVATAGTTRTITFDSAVTLTNSVSLKLIGNADLVISAGDTIDVESQGSGTWWQTGYSNYLRTGTGANVNATSPTVSNPTVSGNLTFSGTGNKFIADFTNATLANRALFQTSTVNGNTYLGVIPNGTSTASLLQAYNNSNPTNASNVQLSITNTEAQIVSAKSGTGSYLPLNFYINNALQLSIATTGVATFSNSIISSDITTQRAGALTTGYMYFGNSGSKYFGFDGTNFVTTMPMNFNILGSSASTTGNAATATNVAWTGVTGKPTTLSGYGITDAASSTATITIGSTTITIGGTAATLAGLTLTSPTFTAPVLGTPASGNFSTGTFTWPTFNQNTSGTAANLSGTPNITVGTIGATSLAAGGFIRSSVTGASHLEQTSGAASAWYKTTIRNDGSDWYFLLSSVQTTQALADAATWNALRPLRINLSTGAVTIDGTGVGTTFGGSVTATNHIGSGAGLTGIPNGALTNSSLTIGSTAISLGGTVANFSGVTLTSPTFVTPALGTPASGNFSTGTFTWPTFNQNTSGTAAGLSGSPNITVGAVTATSYSGAGTGLTGTAAGLTAGNASAVAWSGITSKPTTISGYGITDAATLGNTVGAALGTASAGVATTAARSDHVHPSGTVSVAWSGITSTPTTLSGYGITDSMWNNSAGSSIDLNNLTTAGSYRVGSSLTNKPVGSSDWGALLTYGGSDTRHQLYGTFDTGELYIRGANGIGSTPTWQAWRKVWDTTNLTNNNQLTNGSNYFVNSGAVALSATTVTAAGTVTSSTGLFSSQSGGITNILYSGGGVGIIGTQTNHPVQIYVNNASRIQINADSSVTFAGSGNFASTVTATNHIGPGTGLTGTAASLTAGAASAVAWSGITSKPTTVAGYGITDTLTVTGVADLNTVLGNVINSYSSGYASDSTSNLPVSPGGAAQWWNVFGMGPSSRQSQMAMQSFGTGTGNAPQSAFYIRSKHDAGWGSWIQVWTSASLTNNNQLTNGSNYFVNSGSVALSTTGVTSSGGISGTNYAQNGDGWWRSSGQTGWYNTTYATGIYSNRAGVVTGYNGSSFESAGYFISGAIEKGLQGIYDSTKYQGVFSMGASYVLGSGGTTTGNLYGLAWSHPNAGGAAANMDSHGLMVLINGAYQSSMSYSIKAAGNVTAYSDERFKTNWRSLGENFVERLALVKSGVYDRIDGLKLTQVGVSAQSLLNVMPDAVVKNKDEIGTLAVSYGNAALAASVELAKEIVILKEDRRKVKDLVSDLIDEIALLRKEVAELRNKS